MSLFDTTATLPVIAAQDLVLAYGEHEVLRGVSLRIMPGESWFVVGPNGSGKSTLLNAILGLLQPRAGDIAITRALDDRRRLGFVPQRLDLPVTVPTTVAEFVSLGYTATGLPRSERDRRLISALKQVGLYEHAQQQMTALSGGQRQRACIARALVRDPLLLVVDEPTSGLDLVAERDLMELLAELRRQQPLTLIFVGHDLGLVAAHASHVALVANRGVIAGPAADVLTTEHLSRAFTVPIVATTTGGRVAITLR